MLSALSSSLGGKQLPLAVLTTTVYSTIVYIMAGLNTNGMQYPYFVLVMVLCNIVALSFCQVRRSLGRALCFTTSHGQDSCRFLEPRCNRGAHATCLFVSRGHPGSMSRFLFRDTHDVTTNSRVPCVQLHARPVPPKQRMHGHSSSVYVLLCGVTAPQRCCRAAAETTLGACQELPLFFEYNPRPVPLSRW